MFESLFVIAAMTLGLALRGPPAPKRVVEPRPGWALRGTAEYYGRNVTRPGVRGGLDVVAAERRVRVQRRRGRGLRVRDHALILAPTLAAYHHPGNHTGLLVEAALGYRLTHAGGFRFGVLCAVGYQRSFLAGPTYAVGTGDEVRRIRAAGNHRFAPSLALGFGYDLTRRDDRPRILSAVFSRLGVVAQIPQHASAVPVVFVSVGFALGRRSS